MIDERAKEKRHKNLSLHPLAFDEAVSDILKVKPESKQAEAKMPKKTVMVECPLCKKGFPVQIDTKYNSAEAIPTGGNLPKDKGKDLPCPNCPHQLFIRFIK